MCMYKQVTDWLYSIIEAKNFKDAWVSMETDGVLECFYVPSEAVEEAPVAADQRVRLLGQS